MLGGGWFLGRAVVDAASRRGDSVATFTRSSEVLGAVALHGDRTNSDDLNRLAKSGPWDVVVDTSGFVPREVLRSAEVLTGSLGRYVFVSSVSVYSGWPIEPLTEHSQILDCPADAGPDFGSDDPRGYPTRYGFQKAGCERAVVEVFGGRAALLRPGVILGPWEYVGRLPWWLDRFVRGGEVLAPGSPDRAIQPIDVRDVAGFALDGAAGDFSGAFNLTAPEPSATTFGSMLQSCASVTGSDATVTWADEQFLIEAGVRQWTELPLWRTHAGAWSVSGERAKSAGLRTRPLPETVRDTWQWIVDGGRAVDSDRAGEIGIPPDKEAAILRGWRERLAAT